MTEKGEKYSFSFIPTQDEWKDKLILSVRADDPYDVLGKLNLPQSLGDVIILEMNTKQVQGKLDEKKTREKD